MRGVLQITGVQRKVAALASNEDLSLQRPIALAMFGCGYAY